MLHLTLKQKLSLSASLAIALGGVVVTTLSFIASLNRLDEELNERLFSVTHAYNQYVTDWLVSREAALAAFPDNVDEQHLVTHLRQVKDSGRFDNVFVAFGDGSQQNANRVVLPPDNNDPRRWGWYQNALKAPERVFMDNPTVAAATGANVVSLGLVARLGQQRVVLGADVDIEDLLQQLRQVRLPGSGHMLLTTDQGIIFADQDTRLLNRPIADKSPELTPELVKRLGNSGGLSRLSLNSSPHYLYVAPIDGSHLSTLVFIDRGSVLAPLYRTLWEQALATLAVLALCVLAFNLLCNRLFRPLQQVSGALTLIADGGGDLTRRIRLDSKDEVGTLALSFNQFVGSLAELISHIRQQARELGDSARQGEQQADLTAAELNRQQQEITLVATAITEMASATQEIARHAEQAAQAALSASGSTEQGRDLVLQSRHSINHLAGEIVQASAVIQELNRHAQDINSILATIQGIAEQTNLLALNAAIEAARAGAQGRGFAVVADEVRVLSQRTHTSTGEIQTMIANLQQTTGKAVALMEQSARLAQGTVTDADQAALALDHIYRDVTRICDMAAQIATAAEEQSQVSGDITRNTTSIKDVTDRLAEDTNRSRRQANLLSEQAAELNCKVATFTV
ncbi:methyl-accepting chemotaxis protein [Zobellella denitrificans]|uniref:methyl-accepting chemotaxis protein n=1 Tax=Zobellella denitrificans TaxID=347534 RepID=UPI001C3D186E|nr:methyl-accepting chemotaxis protein [Zobellella denitrificans]